MSTKTGTQFASITMVAVAINVYGGTTTSSPGFTPDAISASRNATDPFTHEMAYLLPQYSANSFSNFSTRSRQSGLPHCPLFTTCETECTSVSSNNGHGKFFVTVLIPPFTANLSFINPLFNEYDRNKAEWSATLKLEYNE